MKNIQILFEDTHLIVLSKPAGLLSQSDVPKDHADKTESLVDKLRIYFGRNYVGLIHRLDRNTSGVMVVAKRSKAANRLSDQLKNGTLSRSYLACLEGNLSIKKNWTHYLWKDDKMNKVFVVDKKNSQFKDAKLAKLQVNPVKIFKWHSSDVTLAEFILETGRSHQIRVQSSHEGFPLVGDAKYGAKTTQIYHRPALHSHRLSFVHPMSHETLIFEAKLPDDFPSQS